MDDWEGARLNEAKEILAYELTALVHGEDEAKKAQDAARALFGSGPESEIPTVTLGADDFKDGVVDILTILTRAELVSSRSEARRAVEQGGVSADGERVTDIRATFTKSELADGIIFRRGKKSYRKVVAE